MRLKCTICLCLYDRDSEICALLCGHLYHVDCINHWLSTNSSCPSCRQRVQRNKIVEKLFLDHEDPVPGQCGAQEEPLSETQANRLSDVQATLQQKELQIRGFEGKVNILKTKIEKEAAKTAQAETKYNEEKLLNKNLRKQIDKLKGQQDDVRMAQDEVKRMREYLGTIQNVELAVKGSESEVTSMIQQYGESTSSVRALATISTTLKRELTMIIQKKNKLKDENHRLKSDSTKHHREMNKKQKEIERLEKDVRFLKMKPSPMTPQPVSRIRTGLNTSDVIAGSPVHTPQPIDVTTPQPVEKNRCAADDFVTTLDFDDDSVPETHHNSQNSKRKLSDSTSDTDNSITKSCVIKIKGRENVCKKKKVDSTEINPMMSYGIMKNRRPAGSGLSVRTGYDGMGTHGKFFSSTSTKPKQSKIMTNFINRC